MSFIFMLTQRCIFFCAFHFLECTLSSGSDDRMQFSSSQPDFAPGGWEAMLLISQTEGQVSFSQPTKPEHMLLGSQLLGTPGASQVILILGSASFHFLTQTRLFHRRADMFFWFLSFSSFQ